MSLGPVPCGRPGGTAPTVDDARPGTGSWHRRHQLERLLHDGASLRISALSLRLGLLRGHDDDPAFQRSVDELQDELHHVLDELREVENRIYPSLLAEAGLGPALRELADESGAVLAVRDAGGRYGTAAEGAAYFAVADCLEASGAESARRVEVLIGRESGTLVLSLRGLPACHADLVQDHARPLGGSVEVTAVTAGLDDPDGGRTITVRIPCE
jgi:hypothetical protein